MTIPDDRAGSNPRSVGPVPSADGTANHSPNPLGEPTGALAGELENHPEIIEDFMESPLDSCDTQTLDEIDGVDGVDGFLGEEGRIGADRFTKEDGSNWWTENRERLLIAKVFCYLADYIILPEPALGVISAWEMASYHMDLWDEFPHLAVTSPEGRCGKSLLLELLEVIGIRPWLFTGGTPAVIFRRIDQERPTILLDEAQFLNRTHNSESAAAIYEIVCASTKKNAVVPRCVGNSFVPLNFHVYCPKVMALIGKLKGILPDRCLSILLKRMTAVEKKMVRHVRKRIRDEEGGDIKTELVEWADNEVVNNRVTEVYNNLDLLPIPNDRMADLLLPLQAVLVAEYGASSYPLNLLERYAAGLDRMDREIEHLSPGVRLLAALRDIFARKRVGSPEGWPEYLSTGQLLAELAQRKEEPWGNWKSGKPLNDEGLAALLREYDIKPKRNRQQTCRGYYCTDLRDAWARYLSLPRSLLPDPSSPSSPSTASGEGV
jgi:hypothetical protein